MRKTRAHFKYAFRFARKQLKETAKVDALARDLSDKEVDNFWKVVHKMNSNGTVQANILLTVLQGKTMLLIIGDNTFLRY